MIIRKKYLSGRISPIGKLYPAVNFSVDEVKARNLK